MGSEYKKSHKLKDYRKRLQSNIHLVWRPKVDIKLIEHRSSGMIMIVLAIS